VLLVYHKRYDVPLNTDNSAEQIFIIGAKLSISEKTAELAISWYELAEGELPNAESIATTYINAHWPDQTTFPLPPRLPSEPVIWVDGGWGPWGKVR